MEAVGRVGQYELRGEARRGVSSARWDGVARRGKYLIEPGARRRWFCEAVMVVGARRCARRHGDEEQQRQRQRRSGGDGSENKPTAEVH